MEKIIISRKGFLLGKFLPPHAGHLHLIRTAQSMTDHLYVLLCSIKSEPIPGALRHEWMQKMVSGVTLIHIEEEVPQSPEEHPDFWNIWLDIFKRYIPGEPDTVFSSELYGEEIAHRMNIRHVMVDEERSAFPVYGTLIRNHPLKYWDYIPEVVRSYFTKRVVLIGPESTGKTVLGSLLAEHYSAPLATEFARELWDQLKDRKLGPKEFAMIGAGQIINEEQALLQGNRLVICDTNLLATKIWADMYQQSCVEWMVRSMRERKYDLYLLMDIDIPWVDDGKRVFEHQRELHFTKTKEEQ